MVLDATTGVAESPYEPAEVRLMPRVTEGLRSLAAAGFMIVVASNQPAAAKRRASVEALRSVHSRIVELLGPAAALIADWRYCLHHPAAIDPALRSCDCRKPSPGLLLDAARDLDLDISRSWMVGDADRDVAAGEAAGCRTILIRHPGSAHRRELPPPDLVAEDLTEAVEAILEWSRQSLGPARAQQP